MISLCLNYLDFYKKGRGGKGKIWGLLKWIGYNYYRIY